MGGLTTEWGIRVNREDGTTTDVWMDSADQAKTYATSPFADLVLRITMVVPMEIPGG